MSFALVIEYLPSEALQIVDKLAKQPLQLFKDHRSLKNAMDSLMRLDMKEFSTDIVQENKLPRHLISASIINHKLQVVANLRILDGLENIGMPKAIYLQIDKESISAEDFERKADFPLSAYTAHGPRKDYFLLRMKDELTTKIERQYKAKRQISSNRNAGRKI